MSAAARDRDEDGEPIVPGQAPTDPVTGKVLETDDIRADGLRQLRVLMEQSIREGKVAKFPRTDDRFLLAFLRARKYNVAKAHMVLCNFTAMWYNPKYAHIINGTTAESTRSFNNLHIVRNLMPRTDRKGNVLSALYAGAADFGSITFEQQFRNTIFGFLAILDSDEAQLHGMTMVETFEGFSLLHSMTMQRMMSGAEQKELMNMMTDTVPIRLRDIWVVKQPWYFSAFWAVVKPFMKRKLTKRVHLLGNDLPALHAAIDPANLPPEFGGTGTMGWDDWLNAAVEQEKTTGMIGGFALPLDVNDPTGEVRRAAAAAATASGAAGAASAAAADAPAADKAAGEPSAPAAAAVGGAAAPVAVGGAGSL